MNADALPRDVTFVAERIGNAWIGEVIDTQTQQRVMRTPQHYASAETARSVAVSMWRAMQPAMEKTT